MTTWYRASCFGKPVGPWRTDREKARGDLIDRDLASYDEWGVFFTDAIAKLEIKSVRVQSRAA